MPAAQLEIAQARRVASPDRHLRAQKKRPRKGLLNGRMWRPVANDGKAVWKLAGQFPITLTEKFAVSLPSPKCRLRLAAAPLVVMSIVLSSHKLGANRAGVVRGQDCNYRRGLWYGRGIRHLCPARRGAPGKSSSRQTERRRAERAGCRQRQGRNACVQQGSEGRDHARPVFIRTNGQWRPERSRAA